MICDMPRRVRLAVDQNIEILPGRISSEEDDDVGPRLQGDD